MRITNSRDARSGLAKRVRMLHSWLMPGLIVIALAGLLGQQAAPHPSTQDAYRPPAIRPFEPGPDFEQARAQRDAEADLRRRPLEGPVTVEAYARSYEFTPVEAEIAYEQGIASAEIRADQTAGPMDGLWQVIDEAGRLLFHLALSDPGTGQVDGGWRGDGASGTALFDGRTLLLENRGSALIERAGAGWRGTLTVEGRARPVRISRQN